MEPSVSQSLDHVTRLSGAIGATLEALIAAFCRLDKSLNRGPLCGDFFDRNYRLYRDSARSTLARSKLWVRRSSR